MAKVTVSTSALAKIGWTIKGQYQDQDVEMRIEWSFNGPVKISRADVDGDYLDCEIDKDDFLNDDLPRLQEMNELSDENYAV